MRYAQLFTEYFLYADSFVRLWVERQKSPGTKALAASVPGDFALQFLDVAPVGDIAACGDDGCGEEPECEGQVGLEVVDETEEDGDEAEDAPVDPEFVPSGFFFFFIGVAEGGGEIAGADDGCHDDGQFFNANGQYLRCPEAERGNDEGHEPPNNPVPFVSFHCLITFRY